MRINTNILSLVSYNATMRASSNLAKSIKRLSTGLKINSASDDAAGLAISEKMTAQIKGLDQATRNAQDGISLLATAEGALNEIHSIMQRMRELAVQAANDTLTVQDRGYIKLEIDQLTTQINDIATQTQFNKKRILNGESAVLWSTSTMDIGVLVSGTLLSKDIFGQTKNAEGNYKITLETIQIGSEQVQKSNILYLKHGTQEYDTLINPYSGMSALDALNIVEGVWRIESRSEPFGGITYTGYPPSGSPSTGIDPNIVGAELDAPGNLPAGSYYIRLSDNVPMMATIDEVGVLGVDQSGSPNDRALSDFDAEFTVSHTASTSSTTVVYREDVGATNSGTVNAGGDTNILVNANNDLNIFTQYVVQSTDDKDLVAGNITIDAGTPEGAYTIYTAGLSVEAAYAAIDAALNAATLTSANHSDLIGLSVAWTSATSNPDNNSTHTGQFTLTNSTSYSLNITQGGTDGGAGVNAVRWLFDDDGGTPDDFTLSALGIKNSRVLQGKDEAEVKISWDGNRADGTVISLNSTTVTTYGDWDNATDISAALNVADSSLFGGSANPFYTTFEVDDALVAFDSWMLFSNARITAAGGADQVGLQFYDQKDSYGYGPITYNFNDGALDGTGTQTTHIRQMLRDDYISGTEVIGEITHNIQFGDIAAGIAASSTPGHFEFSYGERTNAGNVTDWGLDNTNGTKAWYSHVYYGDDTTSFIGGSISAAAGVVTNVEVARMNDINATLMFTYNGTDFDVVGEGYRRNGSSVSIATTGVTGSGGPVIIGGINFTDLTINTAGLSSGDKFVINVAAAAMLDNAGNFESTENISIYEDLGRSGSGESYTQYRFANGATPTASFELGDILIDRFGAYYGTLPGDNFSLTQIGPNTAFGGNLNSTVGTPGVTEPGSYWILADVNNQQQAGSTASSVVTSAYLQKMVNNDYTAFLPKIAYADTTDLRDGLGADFNEYNGSLIFDVLKVENGLLTFRIQAHLIDINGNYQYLEADDFEIETDVDNVDTTNPSSLFTLFGEQLGSFTQPTLYFDFFHLGDSSMWTEGDRFTLSLTASGNEIVSGTVVKNTDIDELTLFSDDRGTALPTTFRFNDGILDNKTMDLHIYQLANNLYKGNSDHFADNQVMDGTLSLSFGEYMPGQLVISDAATFKTMYKEGIDAGVAHYYSRPEDIKQFWNSATGAFMLENGPEQLTIKMGDKEMTVLIDAGVELGKLAARISEMIWKNLLLSSDSIKDDAIDYIYKDQGLAPLWDPDMDLDEIFQFVNTVPGQSANEAVYGTFLAHSVIPGKAYELHFFGSEELMQALAFTEIQKSEERIFEMTVADAHTGRVLSSGERVLAGQAALNAIAPGVSLDLNGIIGVSKVKYYDDLGTFKVNTKPDDPTALFADLNIERYVHVADNALVLQIGANEKEDTVLVLGDMTAKALRILNLEVRSREEAARSLTRLDSAIKRVSTQRAIIGAQINRLEHTMSNLTTASLNLTEAKSRITDADFAKEMMEFTRLNIITQAGHSMMAQANQLSNNILTLMP